MVVHGYAPEQVLGAGFRYTTNPMTKAVDYVEVDGGYFMSGEAFTDLKIRKSPSNEPVQVGNATAIRLRLTVCHVTTFTITIPI